MPLKELKSLEGKVEKSISRIRAKKNELLFAEIELMQKRELELHNANMFLRAKIAESERAHEQQMRYEGAGSEYQAATGLVAFGEYFQRLRTLSSLWSARCPGEPA